MVLDFGSAYSSENSTVDRNDALVVHGICRLSRFLISVQRNIDVEDIKLGQSPKMVNDGKLLSFFFSVNQYGSNMKQPLPVLMLTWRQVEDKTMKVRL